MTVSHAFFFNGYSLFWEQDNQVSSIEIECVEWEK